MEVRVTNRNAFPLPGRYEAIDYLFRPNKPTTITRDAANHIFGLTDANKTRALNCLGILKVGVTYQEALAVLAKVSFEEGHVVYAEQPEPEPEPEPAEPEKDEPAEDEDEKESGGRPGAPRSPGKKSEAGELHVSTPASDDSKGGRRQW